MNTDSRASATKPSRRTASSILSALALAVGLTITGCGAAPAGVSSDSPDAAAPTQDGVAYSQCMRDHGVSGFPDPDSNGGISIDAEKLGMDADSEVFDTAQTACEPLMPRPSREDREQDYAAGLEYAACMRDNGVPGFPDPAPPGDGPATSSQESSGQDQVDPAARLVQAAQAACQDLLPEGAEHSVSGKP